LALWTIGADGALIEAGYETDTSYLRKTYPSPNAITQENFKDHLGDHKYVNNDHPLNNLPFRLLTLCPAGIGTGAPIWSSSRAKLWISVYLVFWKSTSFLASSILMEKSRRGCWTDSFPACFILLYILRTGTSLACLGSLRKVRTTPSPDVWAKITIITGLALTTLTGPTFKDVITVDFFNKYARAGDGAAVAGAQPQPKQTTTRTHALTIIARIVKDERTSNANKDLLSSQGDIGAIMSKYGNIIREYLEQWDNTETTDPDNVTRKFEELVWTNVAIYGTSELSKDGEFKNDFLL
jgi:hypothetical protein